MKRRVRLSEAIKINIEIDPKDLEGMHSEPEMQGPPEPPRNESNRGDCDHREGGKFGEYVDELNSSSRLKSELRKVATRLSEVMDDVIDETALREDKREYRAAQYNSTKTLREWRAFLRGLGAFERRFK